MARRVDGGAPGLCADGPASAASARKWDGGAGEFNECMPYFFVQHRASLSCPFHYIRSETECSFRVQLDYTAGVLPVCFTDHARDALPADFLTSEKFNKMNVVAKGVYRYR